MQVSEEEAQGFEFNTVVVTTGGKRLCERCREMAQPGKCGCGLEDGSAYSRSGSQEALTPPTRAQVGGAIYKDVEVERVVEFLRKK
jgi:hypothetical protein